jgi:hypothetical protein
VESEYGMRNLWVAILLIISLALLLACNETNVSTGVDGDADGLADSDTDRDSDQADGDLEPLVMLTPT